MFFFETQCSIATVFKTCQKRLFHFALITLGIGKSKSGFTRGLDKV